MKIAIKKKNKAIEFTNLKVKGLYEKYSFARHADSFSLYKSSHKHTMFNEVNFIIWRNRKSYNKEIIDFWDKCKIDSIELKEISNDLYYTPAEISNGKTLANKIINVYCYEGTFDEVISDINPEVNYKVENEKISLSYDANMSLVDPLLKEIDVYNIKYDNEYCIILSEHEWSRLQSVICKVLPYLKDYPLIINFYKKFIRV